MASRASRDEGRSCRCHPLNVSYYLLSVISQVEKLDCLQLELFCLQLSFIAYSLFGCSDAHSHCKQKKKQIVSNCKENAPTVHSKTHKCKQRLYPSQTGHFDWSSLLGVSLLWNCRSHKNPALKVGTRSRQCGPKVPGRFAFPGAQNPRICSIPEHRNRLKIARRAK